MTLIQMQYYMSVCHHMSLTKASRELHVSQPALSMAIKEIESNCGVALFQRTPNSLSITDYGIVLLEEVSTIFNQYKHLQQVLSNNLLNRNYVRVGLCTPYGNTVFPEIVSRLREKQPDIQLFITEAGTRQDYENLDNNKVDLIITGKNPEPSEREMQDSSIYCHIPLVQSDMVFAVSCDNPLARKHSVAWEEIVKEPLALLNDSFSLTRVISSELREAGYALPQNVYYTNQMYTVERFIEKNVAAGFLPSQVARDNPRIVGLKCPLPQNRWIYLVYRKDRHLFLCAKMFIKTAKETFSDQWIN